MHPRKQPQPPSLQKLSLDAIARTVVFATREYGEVKKTKSRAVLHRLVKEQHLLRQFVDQIDLDEAARRCCIGVYL